MLLLLRSLKTFFKSKGERALKENLFTTMFKFKLGNLILLKVVF